MLSVRGGGGDSENLKSLSLGPTGRRTPFLAVSWLKDTPPGGVRLGIGRPPLFAPKQRRPLTLLTWGSFLRHEPGGVLTRRRGRSRNRESGQDSGADLRPDLPAPSEPQFLLLSGTGGRSTSLGGRRGYQGGVARQRLTRGARAGNGGVTVGDGARSRGMVQGHSLRDTSRGYAFHLLRVGGKAPGARAVARAASRQAERAPAVP